MSESKRIEILSEQAVIDAKSLSHEWVSVRAAEVVRFTWHGKWEMAQIEWGALSLTCLTINRALALIDAVIAHKLGVSRIAPPPQIIYPQAPRSAA